MSGEGETPCDSDESDRPDETPDYREAWEFYMDEARAKRRRELFGDPSTISA